MGAKVLIYNNSKNYNKNNNKKFNILQYRSTREWQSNGNRRESINVSNCTQDFFKYKIISFLIFTFLTTFRALFSQVLTLYKVQNLQGCVSTLQVCTAEGLFLVLFVRDSASYTLCLKHDVFYLLLNLSCIEYRFSSYLTHLIYSYRFST